MNNWRLWTLLLTAAIVCIVGTAAADDDADQGQNEIPLITVKGSWSGFKSQEMLAEAFYKVSGIRALVSGSDNSQGFNDLAVGKMDVLVYSPEPKITAQQAMTAAFSKKKLLPSRYVVGQFAVYVVVHKDNLVSALSLEQLKGILSGKIKDWSECGCPAGKIAFYGESSRSKSAQIIANVVMNNDRISPAITVLKNAAAISQAVAGNRQAVGIFLYKQEPVKNVKVVPIKCGPTGTLVLPTDENVYEKLYPLIEDLELYLPQEAPEEAKKYCDFATGPEGAKIAKTWFLYPECERQQYFAKRRLADMKAGKGTAISAVGPKNAGQFMQSLTTDFARARETTQLRYQELDESAAVQAFLQGHDMLVLNGPITQRTMILHKAKWDELAGKPVQHSTTGPSTTQPAPAGIREYRLGGRGVAIIVHRRNPLDTLTLDQVRDIFGGKLKSWAGNSSKDSLIGCYGLVPKDSAAVLFHEKVLDTSKCIGLIRKASTAEILEAMLMDFEGIAFVDVGSLPTDPGKAGVKILKIVHNEKAVMPTAQSILDGSYPISRAMYLYLSPLASKTAVDYVQYITSGACADACRRNGLLSLEPKYAARPSARTLRLQRDASIKLAAATRPAATSKPVAATKPSGPSVPPVVKKTYPANPLASPDDMVEALTFDAPTAPDNLNSLKIAQRQEALKKYEQSAAKWKPKDDFHNKKINWKLLLDQVEQGETAKGLKVVAVSGSGYLVTFTVDADKNGDLLLKKRGTPLDVSGVVWEYKLDLKAPGSEEMTASSTFDFGVLLKDAKVVAKEKPTTKK